MARNNLFGVPVHTVGFATFFVLLDTCRTLVEELTVVFVLRCYLTDNALFMRAV